MIHSLDVCSTETISTLSRSEKDDAICDGFLDPKFRSACIQAIAVEKGKQTKDAGVCKDLDVEIRDACVEVIIMTKARDMRDPRVCSEFRNYTPGLHALPEREDRCYMDTVRIMDIDSSSKTFCDIIQSPSARIQCHADIDLRINFLKANPSIPQ